MKKYVIQNVGIASTAKFGCGLGALSNLVPGLIIALVGKAVVSSLRMLLESWQTAELANVLGQSVRVNMLAILKMEGVLKTLQEFDRASVFLCAGIILAWMVLGGVIVAAFGGMLSATYNLTARVFGGIEIELREENALSASRAKAGTHQP
jgi:TRAP-type mannitol/chloroaromatic compound transport system permease small subunit